jgi:hypothetical protein
MAIHINCSKTIMSILCAPVRWKASAADDPATDVARARVEPLRTQVRVVRTNLAIHVNRAMRSSLRRSRVAATPMHVVMHVNRSVTFSLGDARVIYTRRDVRDYLPRASGRAGVVHRYAGPRWRFT